MLHNTTGHHHIHTRIIFDFHHAPTGKHSVYARTLTHLTHKTAIAHNFHACLASHRANAPVLHVAVLAPVRTNLTHMSAPQHVIHATARLDSVDTRLAAHLTDARLATQSADASLTHHADNLCFPRHDINRRAIPQIFNIRRRDMRRIARLNIIAHHPNGSVTTNLTDNKPKSPIHTSVINDRHNLVIISVISVVANINEVTKAPAAHVDVCVAVTDNRRAVITREHYRLVILAHSLHHVLHQRAITIPTPRRIHRKTRTIPTLAERRRFCFPTETSRLARNQLLSRRLSLTLRPKMRRVRTKRTLPRPSATLTRLFLIIHMPLHSHQKTSTPP